MAFEDELGFEWEDVAWAAEEVFDAVKFDILGEDGMDEVFVHMGVIFDHFEEILVFGGVELAVTVFEDGFSFYVFCEFEFIGF